MLLGFLMAESASAADNHTSGQDGAGSGNQTGITVTAPVDASGNQVTVIGNGNTSSTSGGSSEVSPPTAGGGSNGGQPGGTNQPGSGQTSAPGSGQTSAHGTGIGQVSAPLSATGSQAGPLAAAATLAPTGLLPNTGAPADALLLAGLALALLAGGASLLRKEVAC
jgi:LPXTG-motif cell wall-anchored protein